MCRALQGLIIQICEPVWQLIAPNGGVAHMYWDVEEADMIKHVAWLSDLV